jgi:hypothetical protein
LCRAPNTSARIGLRSISVNESGYAAWSMRCFNATVRELDRARRLAVAERIAALHTQHGQEPAVREPLARALYNVTVGEPGSSVHFG